MGIGSGPDPPSAFILKELNAWSVRVWLARLFRYLHLYTCMH
jgi:hypothetical protein